MPAGYEWHTFAVSRPTWNVMLLVTGTRMVRAALEAVRQPAYTGRNRSLPWTFANSILALLVGAGLWLVSPWLATVSVLGMFGLIYLRGYFLPGTPTLTRRYLPESIRTAVGQPIPPERLEVPDPEALLLEAGVLQAEEGDLDLHLEPGFEARWFDRFEAVNRSGGDRQLLAGLVGTESQQLALEPMGDGFVGWIDDRWIGQWESRVAFLADMAVADLLSDSVPNWEALPLATRSTVLGVLRLFLERCPACDGVVSVDEAIRKSCFSETDVIASTCEGCGERVFEAVFDPAEMESGHGED
jgi:hypothetical protein